MDFGDNAVVDMQQVYLRWMDYSLKGIDNGMATEPPIKIFIMGENYWRYENEWPLARTKYTNYYIHSNGKANSVLGDGTLSTEAAADSTTWILSHTIPTIPCPPWAAMLLQRGTERALGSTSGGTSR